MGVASVALREANPDARHALLITIAARCNDIALVWYISSPMVPASLSRNVESGILGRRLIEDKENILPCAYLVF